MDEETIIEAGGDKGGDKGGTVELPKWMSSLPDAYKEDARFSKFEEPSKAWDKFATLLDAEGKMIAIPDEKATDEDRAAFYTKLGRPEKAEAYNITKPENLPDGIPYNPELESAFKSFAFDKGLSDKTTGELWGWYHDLIIKGWNDQQKTEQAAFEGTVNALKDEWRGDAFKVNTEIAHRAFVKFGGDEAKAFLEETKIGNIAIGDHPMFLKIFNAIGKAISDDSAHPGGGDTGGEEKSEEEKARDFFSKSMKK